MGPYGFPRDLAFAREVGGGPSFEDLVARYASDVQAQLMLEELMRVGAATIAEESGMIRVLKRTFIPEQMAPELIEVLLEVPDTLRQLTTIWGVDAQRDSNAGFPDYASKKTGCLLVTWCVID
jgi:hypothetical protein